ncbi:hypothetical protein XBP1_1830012 [Xenorhabdus bovienii str. puntauvense]|uniref:Uncharacterized protein n=2 Tax=Xenorhabdus bovienii TaxID=40576 RepID=A0A077NDM6_XENBV|nr:hypothetical protein XBFFR1_480010 [Xenorhabdus bovienii str. feltiae France]CDG96030.1 hypothetical protein XBP1_1830012 [Xenorhabdus bovienii str. puntauvense]CDH01825.1 hypothetical protein XBFM1_2330043 [Xenorhabdus bovienii str. feltiae Moldova]
MFLLRDNAHQHTCIYLENTLLNIIFLLIAIFRNIILHCLIYYLIKLIGIIRCEYFATSLTGNAISRTTTHDIDNINL